jgi:hypothetical protein
MAPVMILTEIWVTVVVVNGWPAHWLALGQFGRATAFLVLLGATRGWQWAPHGQAERLLWSVWGGYVAACFVYGFSSRSAFGFFDAALELTFYQGLACLTALAFFVLAPTLWGYCTVIGAGFLGLAFVMAADIRLAPVEFGAAWAAVLVVIGLRLRRLGRAAAG